MRDYLKKEILRKIRRSHENIKLTYSLIENNVANLGKLEWGAILSTYKELIEIKNTLHLYNKINYKIALSQSEKRYEDYIGCLEEVILSNVEKKAKRSQSQKSRQ